MNIVENSIEERPSETRGQKRKLSAKRSFIVAGLAGATTIVGFIGILFSTAIEPPKDFTVETAPTQTTESSIPASLALLLPPGGLALFAAKKGYRNRRLANAHFAGKLTSHYTDAEQTLEKVYQNLDSLSFKKETDASSVTRVTAHNIETIYKATPDSAKLALSNKTKTVLRTWGFS